MGGICIQVGSLDLEVQSICDKRRQEEIVNPETLGPRNGR